VNRGCEEEECRYSSVSVASSPPASDVSSSAASDVSGAAAEEGSGSASASSASPDPSGVVGAAPLTSSDHLVALYVVNHAGRDRRVVHGGRADRDVPLAVGQEEDAVERKFLVYVGLRVIGNVQGVVFLNFELLVFNVNNRVHGVALL